MLRFYIVYMYLDMNIVVGFIMYFCVFQLLSVSIWSVIWDLLPSMVFLSACLPISVVEMLVGLLPRLSLFLSKCVFQSFCFKRTKLGATLPHHDSCNYCKAMGWVMPMRSRLHSDDSSLKWWWIINLVHKVNEVVKILHEGWLSNSIANKWVIAWNYQSGVIFTSSNCCTWRTLFMDRCFVSFHELCRKTALFW